MQMLALYLTCKCNSLQRPRCQRNFCSPSSGSSAALVSGEIAPWLRGVSATHRFCRVGLAIAAKLSATTFWKKQATMSIRQYSTNNYNTCKHAKGNVGATCVFHLSKSDSQLVFSLCPRRPPAHDLQILCLQHVCNKCIFGASSAW